MDEETKKEGVEVEQPAVDVKDSSAIDDKASNLPLDSELELSQDDIKNPYAMAKAYYEYNSRLKAKLVEAENLKFEYEAHKQRSAEAIAKAKQALAEKAALQALKEAGITDSDLVELTKEKVLKQITVNDDFSIVDSNYRQTAQKLAEKIGAKTQPVFLGAPSQKEEEPPKDWRELLRYRVKRI